MAYITGDDRNQIKMVMTSLDEMIDPENPVRVIDAYVDSLDLLVLGFKEYCGNNRGQSPYRRADLLKLHIYGYLNKIRSSRKLEVEARRNLELMWLINSIQPDHGTIAGFVTENKKAFRIVLRELTLVLKGWGLIDGKIVAIDGTKIRAQNSRHNCITESTLNKKLEYAEEQITYYLSEIEKNSTDTDGYKEKLKTYQELKKNYQKQKSELKDAGLEQKSLTTDKDSRRMKNNGNLEICYNVQTVVDSKKHFVIDAVAVNDINDQNQLSHMALNAKKLLHKRKMKVLADTGYYNGSEIKKIVDEKLTILIKKVKANNQTKDNQYRKEQFVYDADKDIYTCPSSQELRFFENTSKNGLKYRKYKCCSCNSCPKKSQCTTSTSGRTLQRWELENVNAETASMFIAYNLRRLFSMYSVQELIERFMNPAA